MVPGIIILVKRWENKYEILKVRRVDINQDTRGIQEQAAA